MDKEPITVKGLENLKSELENLKNIQRPKVVAAIAEARSHGDLKENAEYHAAKEQQGLIEGRVLTINDLIARANVIDVTKIDNEGKVIFGSTIKVHDLETKKEGFTDKYIDDYDPMYDNINIIKAAHHVKDKYNYAPTDNELNEFIKLEYDDEMKLKAVKEINSCF